MYDFRVKSLRNRELCNSLREPIVLDESSIENASRIPLRKKEFRSFRVFVEISIFDISIGIIKSKNDVIIFTRLLRHFQSEQLRMVSFFDVLLTARSVRSVLYVWRIRFLTKLVFQRFYDE